MLASLGREFLHRVTIVMSLVSVVARKFYAFEVIWLGGSHPAFIAGGVEQSCQPIGRLYLKVPL